MEPFFAGFLGKCYASVMRPLVARLSMPVLLAAGLVLALAAPAAALEPSQVLVVANENVPASLELGRHYLAARGIPESNFVTVHTTGDYLVSRHNYEQQIRRSIRQAMLDRHLAPRITCVVLMWGVPVRVAGPEHPQADLHAFYGRRAKQAHYQLARDYKLISQPAPPGDGLGPLGKVFGPAAAVEPRPLPQLASILKDFDSAVAARVRAVADLPDATQRQAAWRGLLAVQLDARGLEGLTGLMRRQATPWNSRLDDYLAQARQAGQELAQLPAPPDPQAARQRLDLLQKTGGAVAVQQYAQRQAEATAPPVADAAVDSELALLWWDAYSLDRWLVNPLHVGFKPPPGLSDAKLPPVLMACRIDGPSAADARRIIDDSLAAERQGLRGTFYVDIGGPRRAQDYDKVLERLAAFAQTHSRMNVVVDRAPTVFPERSCPQAALYVGWYSLQTYVDAFEWVRGAVGYHVASFEAMHLRDPASTEWCPRMIQKGVCATIGAVGEPFLQTMPDVDAMLPLLMTGQVSLAEAYWRTVPTVSWRVTLIGDPLYRPFAANPQVRVEDLPPRLWPLGPIPTSQPATASQPWSQGPPTTD